MTALKTTSLRLRGTSVDVLNEEGLDSDGAVTSKSKLQSKVKALSGVDILTATGEYKSTYEILSQIADVWGTINDMDQAALLELISGKRNSSVIAAILQNPKELKEAFEDANNAQGSALKENEKYMDSIQGKIDQLTNATQTMWKNMLDDDVVKFFVELATNLVKILDNLGPMKVLIAGIMTYLTKKSGIDIFSLIPKNANNAKKKIAELKTEIASLEGSESQKNLQKKDALTQQLRTLEAQVAPSEELVAAQDKLTKAQNRLTAARQKDGTDKALKLETVKRYEREVNKAKVEVDNLTTAQNKTGTSGGVAFKKLGKSVKNFAKEIGKALIQMAVMWAIMKLLELGKELIDYLIETPEEAAEKFEELNSTLESTKNELDGIKNELSTIDDKMADIIGKGELSFTDKEELERLKAEREELERELALKEALAKQQQEQVNMQTSDQVQYYKDKGTKTGKTTGENVGTGAGIGAGVGAAVGVASGVGGAILGVKAGAALGAWAGPIGMLIGAAVGAAAGAAIGAGIGGAIAASEPTIGEEIDNMEKNLAEKEEELRKARESYQASGSDDDKKRYEEAQKALSDYRGEMSKYFTELGAYYDNVDLSEEEDPDRYKELKKEMNDFYNERDKWLITSGSKDAKANAIERIFNKEEYKDAYEEINKLQEDFQNGATNINLDSAITGIIDKTAGLRADIEATSMNVQDVVASFAQAAAELNFETVEGVTEQYRKGIDVLNKYNGSLNTIIATYRNTDGTIENISWGSLFDAGGKVISSQVAKALSGTSETVRANFEKIAQQIHDGKLTIEQGINSLGALNTIDVAKVIESQVAELNTSVFKDVGDDISGAINSFKEFSAALESTANSMELLSTAQEQMENSGRISVKTALELMQSTDDWNQLLEIENGNIRLVNNAEEILVQTKIDLIKKNLESALATVRAQLASISATTASADMATTIEESTNLAVQQLSGNMVYLTEVMTAYARVANGEKVDMDAVIANANAAKQAALDATNYTKNAAEVIGREELEKEEQKLLAMLEMYGGIDTVDEFGDNYDYDKTPGDKGGSTTERESAWEKLLKKHQAELDAIAHEKDLIQAEIDEAEAQGFMASEKYYADLIALENEETAALEAKQAAIEKFYNDNKNSMSPEELEEYQSEWRETELAIKESTTAVYEHQEALRELDSEYFNKVSEDIDAINEEIEFMHGLLEDEPVADENGNWSNEALTRLGLYTQQMEKAAFETQRAKDELAELQATTSEADKNTDWYREREEELTQVIYDNANAYNDYKDGIVELNEARVEAIKEGIQDEIDAMNDLIDLKKSELDVERD